MQIVNLSGSMKNSNVKIISRKRKPLFTWGVIIVLVFSFPLLNFLFPVPSTVEYSVMIMDNKGKLMHAFLTSDQKWRMKTELEEISPLLQKAIVQKEDRYFFSHPGVNPFAIARAAFNNIISRRRTSGASTITMQVASALEPGPRTYSKKIVEIFRAFQLEIKFTKKEILQLYLNLVPYGGNIEGVKSASIIYFNKNPDHLSLAEIVALSVIPNRPSSLLVGRNNELIVAERNKWLKRFEEEEVFSAKQIKDAIEEPLEASRSALPKLAPHISYKLKRSGDDIIYSGIDINTQLKTEKLVSDYTRSLYARIIRNAAVIIIDNSTNKIISYVGSADFKDTSDGGQVNGAAAVRQPGSTLKPLLYGMCIDKGLMTPRTIMSDVAVNYGGYSPENYDRRYNGYVSMAWSLEQSLNIPAVKSLESLGKDRFVQQLVSCDFRQVEKDRQKLGLSMVLGGCGSTLEELTALFSLFAHEGIYTKPGFLQEEQSVIGRRVLSPASSFMISEILSKVNRPDFPLSWAATEKMPKIAWKTGTSYGRRDAWSIGYNKNFTVGVWVGNFSGEGSPGLSGAEIATPLLFRIFNTIDYNTGKDWFTRPEECASRIVCQETGMIPGPHCENLVSDDFIPLVSPSLPCDHIKEVLVNEDESMSYCRSCAPAAGYRKKRVKNISPEMQAWMRLRNMAYQEIPSHNPDCEVVFREGRPVITSPGSGHEYFIDRNNPEPIQLSCNTSGDASKVFWYINDQFFRSGSVQEKFFFLPTEGPVKISCSDDKGRNRDIWIKVKFF